MLIIIINACVSIDCILLNVVGMKNGHIFNLKYITNKISVIRSNGFFARILLKVPSSFAPNIRHSGISLLCINLFFSEADQGLKPKN